MCNKTYIFGCFPSSLALIFPSLPFLPYLSRVFPLSLLPSKRMLLILFIIFHEFTQHLSYVWQSGGPSLRVYTQHKWLPSSLLNTHARTHVHSSIHTHSLAYTLSNTHANKHTCTASLNTCPRFSYDVHNPAMMRGVRGG